MHLLSDSELEQETPVPQTIRASGLTTYFQPIFSIRQKAVVGMEALSRGVLADGSLITAANLFKMAAEGGLAQLIENLCRQTAIRKFAGIDGRPDGMLLFLNLDLAAERDLASVPANLEGLLAAAGLAPSNVAVEFLEARLDDMGRFTALAASLRARGFLVVLDDVGAGHSNLDRVHLLRPDVIKVDRGLIAGVDKDYYKQETLKSLVGLSRRIGALVVAEGIETEEEAITALEIGADLLQGYFLGRPQAVASFADGGIIRASTRTEELAHKFKSHMVDTINQRKQEHRRHNVMLSQILGDLSRVKLSAFNKTLGGAIRTYPTVECAYILNDLGFQITETIWNDALEQQPAGTLFHPAPRGTDHSLKEYCYVPLELELQKHTTEPYISLASGSLCRTISTSFRHPGSDSLYVLCVDVRP